MESYCFPAIYKSLTIDSYTFRVTDKYVIDNATFGNVSRFINHSLSPNVEAKKVLVAGIYRLAIVATRDINKEVEVRPD